MPYTIRRHSLYKRSEKRISKQLVDSFNKALTRVLTEPRSIEMLKGYNGILRSCHFCRKPEMRLVFAFYDCKLETGNCFYQEQHDESCTIDVCGGLIDLILVATREEMNHFYGHQKLMADYLREPITNKA